MAESFANVTNQKWIGRLGGAGLVGFEDAYAMSSALTLDHA